MKHVISVMVENKFGVLAHVSGLFSARGFNIASLAVGETEDPTVSRMTIVVDGDERTLEQIKKQLNKLIDVIRVYDLTSTNFIDREMVLIKVKVNAKNRQDVIKIVETVGSYVDSVDANTLTVEAAGDQNKLTTLVELLKPFGIIEMVRTGRIAIAVDGKKGK
ncbi:MAG: acetolactate synthase small subunit [Candidatus Omnitrophica bacterium]|nr:acetolactate synthase small subunit [Candidatus Omnitrophota bacterium]